MRLRQETQRKLKILAALQDLFCLWEQTGDAPMETHVSLYLWISHGQRRELCCEYPETVPCPARATHGADLRAVCGCFHRN